MKRVHRRLFKRATYTVNSVGLQNTKKYYLCAPPNQHPPLSSRRLVSWEKPDERIKYVQRLKMFDGFNLDERSLNENAFDLYARKGRKRKGSQTSAHNIGLNMARVNENGLTADSFWFLGTVAVKLCAIGCQYFHYRRRRKSERVAGWMGRTNEIKTAKLVSYLPERKEEGVEKIRSSLPHLVNFTFQTIKLYRSISVNLQILVGTLFKLAICYGAHGVLSVLIIWLRKGSLLVRKSVKSLQLKVEGK